MNVGVDNLMDNIKWMIHFYPPPYFFWKFMWKLVAPLVILVGVLEKQIRHYSASISVLNGVRVA